MVGRSDLYRDDPPNKGQFSDVANPYINSVVRGGLEAGGDDSTKTFMNYSCVDTKTLSGFETARLQARTCIDNTSSCGTVTISFIGSF